MSNILSNIQFSKKTNTGFVQVEKDKVLLTPIEERKIYEISRWVKFEESKKSMSSEIVNVVDPTHHYCLILNLRENKIWFFVISSRFFKSIFREEIWEFYEFLKTCENIKCPTIIQFEKENEIFKKMMQKYESWTASVDRKNIYILNKDFYSFLDRESFIDISKIKQISKQDIEVYEKSKAINLKEIWVLSRWDKFLMLSQIENNLIEDESQWIQSVFNMELKKLLEKNTDKDGKYL